MLKISLLKKLNLIPHYIYETIVTTYNIEDKSPNAAPMGIIFLDETRVIISPFNSTKTYRNIVEYGCAVINFTYDLELFFESAFSTTKPKLSLNYFNPAAKINAPRLNNSIVSIEFRSREIQKGKDRSKITGDIITWEISAKPFHPINRGFTLVLESIIHATRIVSFKNDTEKVRNLKDLITEYQIIIEKVAPTGNYSKIMTQIQKIIKNKN